MEDETVRDILALLSGTLVALSVGKVAIRSTTKQAYDLRATYVSAARLVYIKFPAI